MLVKFHHLNGLLVEFVNDFLGRDRLLGTQFTSLSCHGQDSPHFLKPQFISSSVLLNRGSAAHESAVR